MADSFQSNRTAPMGSADNAATVTPSDTTDLAQLPRGLYVGGAGNIRVIMKGGQTETFENVAAGILPIRPARVLATGTTATAILALW